MRTQNGISRRHVLGMAVAVGSLAMSVATTGKLSTSLAARTSVRST